MYVLLIVLQEGYSVKHIIGNVYRSNFKTQLLAS